MSGFISEVNDVATVMTHDQTLDLHALRARVGDLLNQLGARLMRRVARNGNGVEVEPATTNAATAALQKRVSRLGQIAAGLAVVDPESLPAHGAGYGSVVTVKDVSTGETDEYTLMVGSLVDIDANQVSLASPIGQALLGKIAGDEITVTTPQKRTRLLVTRVVTLLRLLEDDELRAAAD